MPGMSGGRAGRGESPLAMPKDIANGRPEFRVETLGISIRVAESAIFEDQPPGRNCNMARNAKGSTRSSLPSPPYFTLLTSNFELQTSNLIGSDYRGPAPPPRPPGDGSVSAMSDVFVPVPVANTMYCLF